MNLKKILAGVLACCVIGGTLPYADEKTVDNSVITASAADYTEGTYEHLTYKNYGDYIEISSCDKSAESVVIPSEIYGVPVTSIGTSAFEDCTGLTSVTIPDSVTSIGYDAFYDCTGLKKIAIYNPICKISGSDVISDTATIYCYENSTASEYAKKYDRKMVAWSRPKLNYSITESEADKSNIAKSKSVSAEINYGTIGDTYINTLGSLDKLQECKDSKGNVYAIGGNENSITLFSENTDTKPVTIENDGFTFGAATIDENDNLYVLWGYSISEDIIEEEKGKKY